MKAEECWAGGHHMAAERGAFDVPGDEKAVPAEPEDDVTVPEFHGKVLKVRSGYAVPLFNFKEIVRWT